MSDPTPMIESILGIPPETVDHKAEAEAWLKGAECRGPDEAATTAVAAIAQTHATLYLAEQQRLANLIAWERLTGDSNRAIVRRGLGLWTPDEHDIA